MQIITNNKTEANTVEAEFRVDAADFETAVQSAYLKKRKNIQIAGFRKGKATRKMIETQYGESVFYEDAVNSIYQKALSDAIDELKLDVVDVPDIEVVSVSKDEGVLFKAKFITSPEVAVGGYLGLKVDAPSNTVTEEDVNGRLKEMQLKSARIVDVEDRNTQLGDTVIFNFVGYCDGEKFEGGSAENFNLEIGSGKFIPGFEDQMVDKSIGEDFKVNVTFPEDYNAAELAGKEAVFECRINEIKAPELFPLDDEFAKDVSEFDTLDELKNDLSNKIKEEKDTDRKNAIDDELAKQLIEKLEADIPNVMLEHKIDDLVRDWEYNNSRNGIKLDDYLKYANITIEQFRDLFRESAGNRVKLQLALEKIAEIENIEIPVEELESEFQKLAESHKLPLEQVKRIISPESYKKDMKRDKAFEIVRTNAKISEMK